MSEQTHTPTPWMADGPMVSKAGTLICVADCEDLAKDMPDEEAEANAAFIVRACNSHDALISVLKEYLEWGAMTRSDRDLFDSKFKQVLKIAEEGQ